MSSPITIVDIALIQLRTAVQSYNKNNYISAITLAGAADEILGQIARKESDTDAALDEKVWLDQITDYFYKPRLPLNKILKSRNKVKKQLKHNDSGINIEIKHDFKFEAETFILGAIRNYELITGHMHAKDRTIISFWKWISP